MRQYALSIVGPNGSLLYVSTFKAEVFGTARKVGLCVAKLLRDHRDDNTDGTYPGHVGETRKVFGTTVTRCEPRVAWREVMAYGDMPYALGLTLSEILEDEPKAADLAQGEADPAECGSGKEPAQPVEGAGPLEYSREARIQDHLNDMLEVVESKGVDVFLTLLATNIENCREQNLRRFDGHSYGTELCAGAAMEVVANA